VSFTVACGRDRRAALDRQVLPRGQILPPGLAAQSLVQLRNAPQRGARLVVGLQAAQRNRQLLDGCLQIVDIIIAEVERLPGGGKKTKRKK